MLQDAWNPPAPSRSRPEPLTANGSPWAPTLGLRYVSYPSPDHPGNPTHAFSCSPKSKHRQCHGVRGPRAARSQVTPEEEFLL